MSTITKVQEILKDANQGEYVSLKCENDSTNINGYVVYLSKEKVDAIKLDDWTKGWPKEEPTVLGPLCFTAVDAGATIALKCIGNNLKSATFETSTDGNTWSDYTYATNITLANAGDKVYFKAKTDNTGIIRNSSNYLKFTTSQNAKMVDVSGNVMSLLAPEFKDLKDLSTIRYGNAGTYELCYLFYTCKNIKSCKDLKLPATTLASNCYEYMFANCSSLESVPELPATTLASNCYEYMFANCSSLTTAPEIPVMTLTDNCYKGMFQGCTSLTSAPELPATTLASNCYEEMFYGCTSLTSAPELPATTLADYCYLHMFYGCTSLTSAPELPATTLASGCYQSMFSGCSSLTTAKTIFKSSFYNCTDMFNWCENLTTIESSGFGPSGSDGMSVNEVLANFASLNIPKTEHGVMVICTDGIVTIRQGSGSSSSS